MAETFEDLGLRPELARAAEDAGYSQPAPLQRATIPVLRRGGNAVIHASSGAGVTAAWGLPILDRLAAGEVPAAEDGVEGGLRALVIAPTSEAADRAACELARFASAGGLRLVALAPGWAPPGADADLVVATAADALQALETSALKLESVAAFVVAGASSVVALRGAEALDTLTAALPKEAQRVLVSGELTPEVEDYAERHVRKALRIPPRTAAAEEPSDSIVATVEYEVVREEEKLERVIAQLKPGTVLFCRSDERAAELAEALTLRGFRLGAAGDDDIDAAVASVSADPTELGATRPVSYDVPFDADELRARHAGRGGAALVLARELPHLRRSAREGAIALKPVGGAAAPSDGLEAFRQKLRDAARDEDLEAQLLVLAPLFEERSPAEIAAAASALLRRRPAAPAPAAAASAGSERAGAGARAPRATAGAGAAPEPFTRLFVSIGARDNVRPGDLVGAIAGEAGIPGDRVGRIEVRDTFSIVEVPADIAERVIRSVNGTTLKGRSVRVDYDRKKGGGATPQRGERAERGGPRRQGGPGRARRDRE